LPHPRQRLWFIVHPVATESITSLRACSTAVKIAPRSTALSVTAVGTTRGLLRQIWPTLAATRSASGTPPAWPTPPPSTTSCGSSTPHTPPTPTPTPPPTSSTHSTPPPPPPSRP